VARYVVLLRGINVGPSTRVAMADLRARLNDAGFDAVRTHLQSGNVLLTSTERPPGVRKAAQDAIADLLGKPIDVVVRTADELRAVARTDPLGSVASDGAKSFVLFLGEGHDADAVRALQSAAADTGDVVHADEREIYLWCPDGIRDSPLAKLTMGKRSGPVLTTRNWNTVVRLVGLLDEGEQEG
jgi:uncharacterized protein (DUF1697 family)